MFRGGPVIETVFPGIGEGWKSLPNRAQRRTARSGRRGDAIAGPTREL